MVNKNVIFLLLFLSVSFCVNAQLRQVVVMKNERVLARYQVGDALSFAREGDKKIQIQKILALNDTLIMMNLDSVAYYRIKKLDIRARQGHTFGQKLGAYMMVAGALLPLADLINTTAVRKEDASVDPGVAITGGALFAGGALLFFTRKPYFKPGRKNRIMIVNRESPFYRAKPVADPLLDPQN